MMQMFLNGTPLSYMHVCSEERKGKEMTAEELHDFAVEVLMQEYMDAHAIVEKRDKNEPFEADFSFVNTGKRPSFCYEGVGNTKVNVMVVYDKEMMCDISVLDPSWMVNEYRRTGAIPRVTFASVINENWKDAPLLCGGYFYVMFYSLSLLPDQENKELDRRLTNVELAAKYLEAYKQFDASIIEPYLDKDFHYKSDWVFDELPSRVEFMEYFKGKLQELKNDGYITSEYDLIRNHQTGGVGIRIWEKHSNILLIACKDGRLTSAQMTYHRHRYKPFDPADEIYQNHGDHVDGIMPPETLMKSHIKEIIEDAKRWRQTNTVVTTNYLYEETTKVTSLMYGDTDLRLLTLLCWSDYEKTNEFVSLYPLAKGLPARVEVDKVLEWDNQVEATVLCNFFGFDFAFFAADYYCNKDKYKEESVLDVELAALAMNAGESDRGFQFEGQEALDWYAKIGEEVQYDEAGNVEPVRFSTENLVAYLAHDSKCPDEAEFQSPLEMAGQAEVLGVPFHKANIKICRLDTDYGERELTVPLYFRKDFFPNPQSSDPIRGWLWMTGTIAGEHEAQP